MTNKKPFAVVQFVHESIYTVTADKYFSGSFKECEKRYNELQEKYIKRDFAIVRNFEGDEISADYTQIFHPQID
jgi:hypothetical protein